MTTPQPNFMDYINNYYNKTTEYISQAGQSMSNWVKSKMYTTGGRRTRRKKSHGGMSSIHGAKITGIHTAKASYVGGKKRRHKRSRHHARK
jgi:hypothetical protein